MPVALENLTKSNYARSLLAEVARNEYRVVLVAAARRDRSISDETDAAAQRAIWLRPRTHGMYFSNFADNRGRARYFRPSSLELANRILRGLTPDALWNFKFLLCFSSFLPPRLSFCRFFKTKFIDNEPNVVTNHSWTTRIEYTSSRRERNLDTPVLMGTPILRVTCLRDLRGENVISNIEKHFRVSEHKYPE